jgi:tRNA(fMet)-specific endonuclease VapC
MIAGMFVLDTDHMSLLEWDNVGAFRLRERLARCEPSEVATTIVCYEEQVRGWMAYIARARSINQQIEAYRRLRNHLDNYRQIPILDFDEKSASRYESLRRARIRIGAMDLKIAAIALASDVTLLSRNLADFKQVPGLKVEDWSN